MREAGTWVRIKQDHPTYPKLRGKRARIIRGEVTENRRHLYVVETAPSVQVAVFGDEIEDVEKKPRKPLAPIERHEFIMGEPANPQVCAECGLTQRNGVHP